MILWNTVIHFQEKDSTSSSSNEPSSPMSNASFMELLTENANLTKKCKFLEEENNNSENNNNSSDNSTNNPWKNELKLAEQKISDLSEALEDRVSEVQLIEDKVKLQELNENLAEKIQAQQEIISKSQTQLQDAKDQADLLEFRVLELEEENEKVCFLCSINSY